MKHLLVIKHGEINREIVVRILHMELRYKNPFVKSNELEKNDLSIYQYNHDITLVLFDESLKHEIEKFQSALLESGLESKIVENVLNIEGIVEVIQDELTITDKTKAQIAADVQLLDFSQYD